MQMGRILVVGADPMGRLLLRWLLENEGHRVREADYSRDALTEISAWNPDVVVLELHVPSPGRAEFLAELRHRAGRPDVLVVAADFRACIDLDATVVSEYHGQKLTEHVDALLHNRSDTRELTEDLDAIEEPGPGTGPRHL